MARQLVCPHGHRWEVGSAHTASTPAVCPVCQAPAVTPNPRTVAFVPERTRLPDSAPPGPQTLPQTTPTPTGPTEYPTIPGYEIMGELGRGGMGVVYWAWQPELS